MTHNESMPSRTRHRPSDCFDVAGAFPDRVGNPKQAGVLAVERHAAVRAIVRLVGLHAGTAMLMRRVLIHGRFPRAKPR